MAGDTWQPTYELSTRAGAALDIKISRCITSVGGGHAVNNILSYTPNAEGPHVHQRRKPGHIDDGLGFLAAGKIRKELLHILVVVGVYLKVVWMGQDCTGLCLKDRG
jgi:hypothetical protein